MKVSKLLAMSALLLAGSGAAEAALVDGVRQKPQPPYLWLPHTYPAVKAM